MAFLFFTVCLFHFCTWSTCTLGSENLTDIYLLGLFPLSGPWDGGQAMLPAAEMAVDDINARSDILPGYRLHLECYDTECDAGLGVKALAERICEPPTKIMIIGAACSPVSQAVAQAAHHWNLVQISYVSVSPTLSIKRTYPNFFRLVASEAALNEARIEILKHFQWKHVATIHQSYQLFSTMIEDLVSRMKGHYNIVAQEMFSEDPKTAVQRLKDADARIIIGGFYRDKARKVFCEAYKLGFYGKQVWILTAALAYDDTWWKQEDNQITCTADQLQKTIQRSFILDNFYFNQNEMEEGSTGMSAQRFRKIFKERTRNMTQPVSGAGRAPVGYDTVWAAAIALNETMSYLSKSGSTKTLTSFTYDDKEMAQLMKEKLMETSFSSTSGRVALDKNGDGIRLVNIQTIRGPELESIGVYDRTKSSEKRLEIADIWKGNIPKDSIQTQRVGISSPLPNYIVMTSLSSLGIVVAVIFLTFNIIKRNVKIIRMSSPTINNIILIGCILAYLSVYIEDINNTSSCFCCMVKMTLILLAFSLSFGALFAKTWRVHTVFTASLQMKKRSVKDHTLCLMIVGLVCLNSVVLIIWFTVRPPTTVTEDIPDKKDVQEDLIIQYVRHYCYSKTQEYFIIAILLIQGVFLLLGVFLAWETRKVKFSILNESRYIGMCIYNVVVLGVIGVLVSYSLRNNTSLVYVIISCITILCTTVTQCLLFIPKMLAYRKFVQGQLKDFTVHNVCDQFTPLSAKATTASQTNLCDCEGKQRVETLE